jgi:bifunctional DNase/RNase
MLVEAEIWTIARTDQGNAVLVRPIGSDIVVPIFIGQLEAQSILIGLGNVPMPRPLTHDLYISTLKYLKAKVEKVEITSLKEGTFYAQLVLKINGERIIIDSRPSDSIAIASRLKCPLFISENVVDEAGILINSIAEENPETVATSKETEISKLQKALDKAVESENYEEAAKLRDRLRELQDSG